VLRELKLRHRALPRPRFEALRDVLLQSPLVGASTLGGTFLASRGFAVIFREPGRARVVDSFPQLAAHLDATLGAPAIKAMTPWWRPRHERIPNAWYLNVLLVGEGGMVGRHLDVTLRGVAHVDDALPELVSVLYLKVPRAQGGDLRLSHANGRTRYVTPSENTLVHFRGDLLHEVCAFYGAPDGLRASLVIEQYHFAPDVLARVPEFQLESRAGFSAYLKHHEKRPAPAFELER
jgi:hypothetical protein